MTLNMAASMGSAYVFRSESYTITELEKRQLFLRSYQFSRKQSVAHRIRKSFFKIKKALLIRFRSARNLRKTLWFKLKNGLFFNTRRRRLFRRLHSHAYCSRHSSCFCYC